MANAPEASPTELREARSGRLNDLLEGVGREKNWRSLGRAITLVENTPPWEINIPETSERTHIVGITGPPGAGKSTLTGQLIAAYSDEGARVAVLAVDPSSPISGGAVLGDRIRMESQIEGHPEVFVRSLASRGAHGALASATRNAARVLEATGRFDVVLIETVGAGQTEVAIAGLADTVALVTVPGLGDAVQAIKAGLMEVSDLIVVNMADRPGAAETVRHLRLTLGAGVEVIQTVAKDGTGVSELRNVLDERWKALSDGDLLAQLREDKQLSEAVLVAQEWVEWGASRASVSGDLDSSVARILKEAHTKWDK